jgi:Fe-S cluster biosynthesis and repair protein YggX
MAEMITCSRCSRTVPGLDRAPYPGELGRQLLANACGDCWAEWQNMEVMVINELRLNFMDPNSMEVLAQHIRDFFFLPPPASDATPPDAAS